MELHHCGYRAVNGTAICVDPHNINVAKWVKRVLQNEATDIYDLSEQDCSLSFCVGRAVPDFARKIG